jgi:hypothetical protein
VTKDADMKDTKTVIDTDNEVSKKRKRVEVDNEQEEKKAKKEKKKEKKDKKDKKSKK